jgi:cytochrome c biogenesis protein CcmG/thiol:disulfide interchange protein DsbE
MTAPRRQRPGKAPRRGPSPSTIVVALGALVIVGAAVAAIALAPSAPSATGVPGSSTPAATSSHVASGTLPPYAEGADDPAIGQPAPTVEGASFDGTPVSLEADGQPKLILFLAHWCPHCQREVPVVQAWIDANGMPEGVDLISVATAIDPTRPNYPPDAWLARERWQPPVIVDRDNQIAASYGLNAFPYWVAVAADGTVARRLTGELAPNQIESIIAPLVAGP